MELSEKSSQVIYIDEPELGFAHGQKCDHPKDGLYLYGPHRTESGEIITVNAGIIGTESGINFLQKKLDEINKFIAVPPPKKTDKLNRLHISDFPGLTEAFGIRLNKKVLVKRTVDLNRIDEATRNVNHHEAVRKAVDLYVNEIDYHELNEELSVDVWLLVLPELIFERCKPQSKRTGVPLVKGDFSKKQKKPVDMPLFNDVLDF